MPPCALTPRPAANDAPKGGGGLLASLLPRPPRAPDTKVASTTPDKSAAQQVWVLREGQPTPVAVTVGQSDGRMTEVTSAELEAGASVITARMSSKP